jgi:uncharacterized protein YcbK (DUF882 family)
MAKLLVNRLSETMTAAQTTQFFKGIQMAMDALPKKPILSNDEFSKIPKKGEARRKEANLMLHIIRRFPQFLPSALTVKDVENDNALYEQLRELSTFQVRKLVELIEVLSGLAGGEEMNAYSRYIENVRSAAKDGNPDAIEALNLIEDVERNKGGGNNRKKPTTPSKI